MPKDITTYELQLRNARAKTEEKNKAKVLERDNHQCLFCGNNEFHIWKLDGTSKIKHMICICGECQWTLAKCMQQNNLSDFLKPNIVWFLLDFLAAKKKVQNNKG